MTASRFARLIKTGVTGVTSVTHIDKPSISAGFEGIEEVTPARLAGVIGVTAAASLPPELIDAFEERAGILEHDAGLPRAEAERLAQLDVFAVDHAK